MPHRNSPPDYAIAGFRLMGHIFEQQVRIAQIFGQAALAHHPFFRHAPQSPAARAGDIKVTKPVRKTRAPSAPPSMPDMDERDQSMPV